MTRISARCKPEALRKTQAGSLKLALRENLKRRKSQAKGRSHVIAAPSDDVDVSLHDDSEKKPGK